MVGHQAEGMDANLVAPGETIEEIEVVEELGAGLEDALFTAAALVDVIDLPNVPVALAGWSGGELFGFGLHGGGVY